MARNGSTPSTSTLVSLSLSLLLLSHFAPLASAAVPAWSWDKLSTFIHCSNSSGPLNAEIIAAMASSSFTVIEKYQAMASPPVAMGGEQKVIAAATAIKEVNPNATIFLYFAVDYVRTWYALGSWFEAHPELEVHNADGSLATVSSNDHGDNTWHIFDYAQEEARYAWANAVANVVYTRDPYGARLFDGVFIDGYRYSSWATDLIPKATAAEQQNWLEGINTTGDILADALGDDVIRIINPGQTFNLWRGYNAISIEFFDGSVGSITFLQQLVANGIFVEVHVYAGANMGVFNISLAAYLVAVGEGAYFGAGAQWDMCDDWLVPNHPEYSKSLGAPDGPASVTNGVYSRTFGGQKVKVVLDTGKQLSCIVWGDGSTTGNNCSA